MTNFVNIMLLAFLGGIAIPLGAWLSTHLKIKNRILQLEFYHGMIALGGGALIAAVALVLVPEGLEQITHYKLWVSSLAFSGGGTFFMLLDRWMSKRKSTMSQLIAMMSDYIPEAIALGATFAGNKSSAVLLAIIMFAQNFPEGFNAFKEIVDEKKPHVNRRKVLILFALLSLAGPVCSLLGAVVFSKAETMLGILMLFGGGGILYLIFRDIAPDSKMDKHWIPSYGAIIGFLFGIIGYIITQ